MYPPVVVVAARVMTEEMLSIDEEDEDEKARADALALTVTASMQGPGARMTKNRSMAPASKSTLCVELLPSGKDFVADYKLVKVAPVKEERPVGLPAAFIPLDVVGELLLRKVVGLVCKPYLGAVDSIGPAAGSSGGLGSAKGTNGSEKGDVSGKGSSKGSSRKDMINSGKDISGRDISGQDMSEKHGGQGGLSGHSGKDGKSLNGLTGGKKRKRRLKDKTKEYQVSIHAKAPVSSTEVHGSDGGGGDFEKGSTGEHMVNGAKGLVVRLYDQETAETLVLHIAASELQRVCVSHGAALLLGDMNGVKSESDARPPLPPLSKGLQSMIAVDDLKVRHQGPILWLAIILFLAVCSTLF